MDPLSTEATSGIQEEDAGRRRRRSRPAGDVDDDAVDLRTGTSTPMTSLDERRRPRRLSRRDHHRVQRPPDRRRRSRRHRRSTVRRDEAGRPRGAPLVTRRADDRVRGRSRGGEDRQPLRPRRGLGRRDPADRSRTDQQGPVDHVAELQPRRSIGPVHESTPVRCLCLLDRGGGPTGLAPLVGPGVRRGAIARPARCGLRRILTGRQHDRLHPRLRGRGARRPWLANADGSDRRQIVDGRFFLPRWSPDGTRIAYDSEREGVWVVDVGTGETTRVADRTGWPEWVDDDTLLIPE